MKENIEDTDGEEKKIIKVKKSKLKKTVSVAKMSFIR